MRAEVRRVAVLAAVVLLASASPSRAGLCGDTSGDGFFNAFDALATLKLAVTSGYDRRGDVAPEQSQGNGSITAGDALVSLRASVEARVPPCRGWTKTRAVVTTASYNFDPFGGFATIDLATRAVAFRAAAIYGDAVVRTPDGTPVVVNRGTRSSLQVLDISKPGLPNVKACSVKDNFNSNPQDVVFVSAEKGYVTPYAGSELFVISRPILFDPELDPACSSIITNRIDLSGFDDDGIPEMDQMALVGSDLFVSLQLLNAEFQPGDTSVIAVIDTTTDTVKGSIPLAFQNPFAQTKGLYWDEFQQLLFVGGPGNTGNVLDDGGIEAIDPAAMESAGLVLSGADIQANIFDFVIAGTARAFAIVVDGTPVPGSETPKSAGLMSNSVVEISLVTRSVTKRLLTSTALITDIEMTETGELWVAYRGESGEDPPGIRIFDVRAEPVEILSARTTLAQPPFTLAFVD
ncbi:MAG: hypothetical protein ABR538_16200 [Candidatus Binatia bacterium]